MTRPSLTVLAIATTMACGIHCLAETPPELRVGRAGHAFDHLGGINDQAAAAAASGATIIYAGGFGGYGHEGWPAESEIIARRDALSAYNRAARDKGVELIIGYVCATSIVRIESFDKNWSAEFRQRFSTPPADWRQVAQDGKPLDSWYGGDYRPACMNNPDWRAYEKFVVRQQLEVGHDGIFFDNPTVHPQGCYCSHCMEKFAAFLEQRGAIAAVDVPAAGDRLEALRRIATEQSQEFLRFRCTITRDFLAEMRTFARTINPRALITCNNSLNSPQAFYAQCRSYAYNIDEMSKVEDLVVVEDMTTQPRATGNGQFVEYGSMYEQLHAISHGKPIVAVTVADGDYHTAPNLVRLAMAEAAAHGASYLSWPTWPAPQRARMIAAIRPQAELLRRNEALLNDVRPRADVVLFLPFRRWVETDQCTATNLAAALTSANVQYEVVSEDGFCPAVLRDSRRVFLVESLSALTPDERTAVGAFQKKGGRVVVADGPEWLAKVREAVGTPALTVQGPPGVRAVVRDEPKRTIIHLYNLNVERLSSFDDQVNPANDVRLTVRVPFLRVNAVHIETADDGATSGPLEFVSRTEGAETVLELAVPPLKISAIVLIDGEI